MILLWFAVGCVAVLYCWRLAWFIAGAVLVPLVTAAAWCLGVVSGWWDRWHGKEGDGEGLTPGGEPARPRAEVIDLAAARRGRTRQRH